MGCGIVHNPGPSKPTREPQAFWASLFGPYDGFGFFPLVVREQSNAVIMSV